MRRLTVAALAVLQLSLAGCGSWGGRQEPTLRDVRARSVPVQPQVLPRVEWQRVQQSYEAVLQGAADERLRARALRRLADLSLEEAERVQSVPAGTSGTSSKGAPAALFAAIKNYEFLLKNYPGQPGNDHLIYQLARAYDLNGEPGKVLGLFDRLVSEYPDSDLYQEAQFRRGELFFVRQAYPQAQQAYAAVVARGAQGAFYDKALYKHGWCLFKQGDFNAALQSFAGLLDHHFGAERQAVPLDAQLLDDVFRVVSLSFSFQQGAPAVADFFARNGHRSYEDEVYRNLGEFYLRQERHEDGAKTYAAFADAYPEHREAPQFMVRVIDAYKQGIQPDRELAAMVEFVNRYGLDSPYWERQSVELKEQIKPRLREKLEYLAQYHHSRAQNSASSEEYRAAAYWYSRFLESFPDHPRAPSMQFLLAESQFESRDYAAAVLSYERAAYGYAAHPQSAEAGYAVLQAYDAWMKHAPGDERDSLRRAALSGAERFVDVFPEDERRSSVLLRVAQEYHDLKDIPLAVESARQFLTQPGKKDRDMRRKAWSILAHGQFDLGEFAQSEQASQEVLRLLPDGDAQRAQFEERLAAAIYKQGEQAQRQARPGEAAEHFLRVATMVPGTQLRPAAQYDAASALIAAGQWDQAEGVLEGFVRDYPGHDLEAGAREKLVLAYEKSEQWAKAAALYEQLTWREEDPDRGRGLLWRAVELYEKGGDAGKAGVACRRYVETFPRPLDEAQEARQKLADISRQLGDPGARRHWLNQIVDEFAVAGGSEQSRYLAAAATLELAQPAFEEFRKARLNLPLEEALKEKKRLMQNGIRAYDRAAEYGVAEVTTAATYHIAEIYRNFGRDLLDSQRPADLGLDELEQYDLLLEEQAFPFEEKAIQIHEANVKYVDRGIYDQWVRKSFDALAEMRPIRYRKAEEAENHVRILE